MEKITRFLIKFGDVVIIVMVWLFINSILALLISFVWNLVANNYGFSEIMWLHMFILIFLLGIMKNGIYLLIKTIRGK